MENNKYYAPKLEEFHSGFEYEYSYQGGEWINTTFDIGAGDISEMEGTYHEFSPNCPYTKCRVKYLDREDLESLGFAALEESKIAELGLGHRDNLYYKKCNITDNDKYLEVMIHFSKFWLPTERGIMVYTKYNGALRGYGKPSVVFSGRVNNKSELVKLLEMLNINQ